MRTVCPKCGTPRAKGAKCKPCKNARQRAQYAANPKRREQNRAYRAANPEREREQNRARYAANPEKYRAQARALRAASPEKYRERARALRAASPEKYREQGRALRVNATVAELDATFTGFCHACGDATTPRGLSVAGYVRRATPQKVASKPPPERCDLLLTCSTP